MKSEKITKKPEPGGKRRYEDACATAHAMDLIGERWALLVVRELMMGPKRFSDLKAGLPGISANVLTQRLEGLEASGILFKRRLPPPVSAQVYELTEWGYETEPIFQTMGRWAARSPHHDPTLPFSAASLALSMRTMIDADRAADLKAKIGFRLGEETLLVELEEGRLEVGRNDLKSADLIFEAAPPIMAAAFYGGQPLEALEAAGLLKVEGDRALAARYVTLFPLPPKVGEEG